MPERPSFFLPEIREMLAKGQAAEIVEALADEHPSDWAEWICQLDDEPMDELFLALGAVDDLQAETYEHLPEEKQVEILRRQGPDRMVPIIAKMGSDLQTDLAMQLDEEERQPLLARLPQSDRADIKSLLEHEEGTAGACMSKEFAAVRMKDTVAQALVHIKEVAPQKETIYVIYVLDTQGRLLGTASLRDLIVADPETPVGEIMDTKVKSLHVDADQEEAARMLQKYDLIALPIVDGINRLQGIVTYDDVMDVFEEEATEDAQMMGAVSPFEEAYFHIGFWTLARKRVGWLTLLFFSEFLSVAALRYFTDSDGELGQSPGTALATLLTLIPLILATGGNSGSQSATLICRGLATEEIRLRDWLRVWFRETRTGLVLGSFIAIFGFLHAISLDSAGAQHFAWVVALALVCVVTWSTQMGGLFPFILKRLHLDPAIASTPLVASVSDVTGVVIYFSIARMMHII